MPGHPKQDPPLLNYLDELFEKLREQIPPAIEQHDQTAIHQARVATRRLGAAIAVLKPVLAKPNRQEFTTILRKLRSRLGPLRDLDVMIDLVETTVRSPKTNAPVPNDAVQAQDAPAAKTSAAAWVLMHLNHQREQRRAKAMKKVDAEKVLLKLSVWPRIDEELLAAGHAIDSLLAESLHLQLDEFVAHADAISQRGSSDPAGKMRDPHELRIAGKSLRYSLEMAVANGHRLPAQVTRSFKKMQDMLGQWHDFIVLAERLMSLSIEQLLAHHDAPLQSEVLNLARRYLSSATRSLDRFSSLWKTSGDEITAIIRRTFPLTRAVDPAAFTRSKTDPDLFDLPETPADPPPEATLPGESSAA